MQERTVYRHFPTKDALMAALWVHDLRCDASAANPRTPLAHPWELFTDNACHGGFWACPYLPRTALPFAAAMGWAAGSRAISAAFETKLKVMTSCHPRSTSTRSR